MKISKSKIALFAMCLGIFVVMLDTTIMNIALPEIQESLNTSLSSLSWALNSYTIIFAATCIPLGKLANIFGKKMFYIGALIFFALGSVLSGLSVDVVWLIFGRILQSFGAAVLFSLSMDLGISTQPDQLKRRATLFVGITQGLAAAFGPTVGGIITQFMGWRWIFFINAPIVLLSLLLCAYALPENLAKDESKIDWLGSFLTIAALVPLTMALIQFRYWGFSLPTILLLIVFVVAALAFSFWERHVAVPMIDLSLFKNSNFNLAATATLFGQLLLVGFMVIMPTFLTTMYGKSAFASALLVTPATVMIFLLSPLAGLLVQKINAKKLLALGFLLISIGYIGLATLAPTLSYVTYILCSFLIGAGYGVIVGPISVLSTMGFKGSQLTASQSVIGVLRQLGTVLAVAIFVSGLTFNIENAKKNAISYTNNQVQKLELPKSEKKNITEKADAKITNHGDKKSKQQSLSTQKKNLVEKLYERYLNDHRLKEEGLPTATSKQIKGKIAEQVNHSFERLSDTLVKIQEKAKKEYVHAFTKLYLYAAPISLLIALMFFFAPTKPLILRKSNDEK